ncbi:MAG: NAD-dependent epimerase/dehydratase family protein [Acidimicrobiia bacterium]
MHSLVLGGSQFVGLHLVHALVEQGHQVTVLNRGMTPATYPPGVRRLQADRFDAATMRQALGNDTFDAVFEVSGYTPQEVGIAVEILKGRMGHLLFTSSVAVYAPADVFPLTEASPLMGDPKGRKYSWDKVACEALLQEAAATHGFHLTLVRPPNIYGPHNHVLSREFAYFARLEQQRKILLPAHGLSMLPLVYVDDVAQGFLRCLSNPNAHGEIFNIASGDLVNLRGWVQVLADVVGVEPDIVSVPRELEAYVEWSPDIPVPADSFPYGWRRSAIHSIDKAKRLLDYTPTPLVQGVRETYEWYRRQPSERWRSDFSRDDACLREMGLA